MLNGGPWLAAGFRCSCAAAAGPGDAKIKHLCFMQTHIKYQVKRIIYSSFALCQTQRGGQILPRFTIIRARIIAEAALAVYLLDAKCTESNSVFFLLRLNITSEREQYVSSALNHTFFLIQPRL